MKFEIKICGITRHEDLETLSRLGVDYAGFVAVGSSRRFVPFARLRELAGAAPKNLQTVLVAAGMEKESLRELFMESGCSILQLHGKESPEYAAFFSGLRVWKALSPGDDPGNYPAVERFLCDGTRPGSGELSDWDYAGNVAQKYPVLLAGGISAENIDRALQIPGLRGADLSSSVESAPGIKSGELIEQFLIRLRRSL